MKFQDGMNYKLIIYNLFNHILYYFFSFLFKSNFLFVFINVNNTKEFEDFFKMNFFFEFMVILFNFTELKLVDFIGANFFEFL